MCAGTRKKVLIPIVFRISCKPITTRIFEKYRISAAGTRRFALLRVRRTTSNAGAGKALIYIVPVSFVVNLIILSKNSSARTMHDIPVGQPIDARRFRGVPIRLVNSGRFNVEILAKQPAMAILPPVIAACLYPWTHIWTGRLLEEPPVA